MLRVVKAVEIKVLSDQFCDNEVLFGLEAVTCFLVLPVKRTLVFALRVLHVVLIVDDFEDAASDLSSELAQDAVGLHRLDHEVLEFIHFA